MSEKHGIIYFQPGQIIFHVTGNFNGNSTSLINWANDVARDWVNTPSQKRARNVTITDSKVLNFVSSQNPDSPTYPQSRGTTSSLSIVAERPLGVSFFERISSLFKKTPRAIIPSPFSLAFANVESDQWPKIPPPAKPEDVLVLPEHQQEVQADVQKDLLDLANFLHNKRRTAPVTLQVVSLNWLAGGSGDSQPGTTGGPGGEPSPAQSADVGKHHFKIPAVLSRVAPRLQSKGETRVIVAVLDTAYSEEKLLEFYRKWVSDVKAPQEPHPAIEALLGANRRLHVHTHPDVDLYLPGFRMDGHDYDMTDHGVFVAGIINSLAPDAEIHLYQVLNKYGLGDLLSIGSALQDIIVTFRDKPSLINMSLTMNMPLEEEHLQPNDHFGMGRAILDRRPRPIWFWRLIHWICRILEWIFGRRFLGCSGSWFYRQAIPFEWMSDLVHGLGYGIIAAAGNNGEVGHRPSALYPAAFDSVLGIGALSRGNPWSRTTPLEPASYSNLADTPTIRGIAGFGGEKGENNGLLGVYMGDFPKPEKLPRPENKTGWAWWSGTSFATPIISGLAALLVINGSAASPQDAINKILDFGGTVPSTRDYEGTIDAEQQR